MKLEWPLFLENKVQKLVKPDINESRNKRLCFRNEEECSFLEDNIKEIIHILEAHFMKRFMQ